MYKEVILFNYSVLGVTAGHWRIVPGHLGANRLVSNGLVQNGSCEVNQALLVM